MAPTKLHGRAFYESIGSPKHVVAPMVDQSEFAWRLLTRSFLPPGLRRSILAYSPMLHAKLFADGARYRNEHFKPLKPSQSLTAAGEDEALESARSADGEAFQDGNPTNDRPLFVQFCANDPDMLLQSARLVQAHCDAVDLNLGCPQGIAKRGNYGAFLQEDWETIHKLINNLHTNLDIPVTAKMRILETREKTLQYARMILDAGASILTVHGRQREQKGHNTGVADWEAIRFLRQNLPPETVLFANGNILQYEDIQKCLDVTGADGVMSAEGNLYDPAIFVGEPRVEDGHGEYWRGTDGKGGWRVDAVFRRYLDIIYEHVLCRAPPKRQPLLQASDAPLPRDKPTESLPEDKPRASKKQKRSEAKQRGKPARSSDANLIAMQSHLFHLLRPLVSRRTDVRDQLARTRVGDMDGYEEVLSLTEAAVHEGLRSYRDDPATFDDEETETVPALQRPNDQNAEPHRQPESSETIRRCRRPYFICQPRVRPLPHEAMANGALRLSKKELAALETAETERAQLAREVGVPPDGSMETVQHSGVKRKQADTAEDQEEVQIPREGLVCG